MHKNSIKGKTALITGAAKRVGRATAIALADEGVNVVLHYRTSSVEVNDLRRQLLERGVESWTVHADFEKSEEYETLIERAMNVAGPINILINNASIFPVGGLREITFGDLTINMQVNAWVPFILSRTFAQKTGAEKIINYLDTKINGYDWFHTAYYLSKRTMADLTRMTALEYAPGITVNAVAPGLILPPEGKDEAYLDRLTGTVPLKRHGDPKDVADTTIFLLKSNFITGQIIYVDGGRHLEEAPDG